MTVQARDALSGASLLSNPRVGHAACGRHAGGGARACRRSFGSKPSLLPNDPRLEARLDTGSIRAANRVMKWSKYSRLHRFLLSYCSSPSLSARDAVSLLSVFPCRVAGSAKASPRSGLTFAQFGFGLFRSRNAKCLDTSVIRRFNRRMVVADKTASQQVVRVIDAATQWAAHRPLCWTTWQGGRPPLHPPCRFARHAETVPVSAPFGLCSVGAPSWFREVRP
jgi:hypothetical protein